MGFQSLPFENQGSEYCVIIGAQFNSAIGTLTANSFTTVLEIEDDGERILDHIVAVGTNYVAAPATGGTVFLFQLTKKFLIPPNGSANTSSGVIGSVQVIKCRDTTAQDGKNSLENALALMNG